MKKKKKKNAKIWQNGSSAIKIQQNYSYQAEFQQDC